MPGYYKDFNNGRGGIKVGSARIFKINNSRDWNDSRGWHNLAEELN